MTPCCTLRTSHEKYLFTAFLIAIVMHAVAFALWPEYVPRAYRLSEVKVPILVDLPTPDIDIPPKPPPVEPPRVPLDIEPSDDPDADDTIEPTVFSPGDPLPEPPDESAMLQRHFWHFEQPPELVKATPPGYPDLARKAGVEGTVVVLLVVDETGRVRDAWIGNSDAEIFNKPALEAAYGYVFEPALQNERPVKATISLTFRFSLNE
jgi:protein TonB